MSQLASSVSRLESQGKLPSQTVINPKQNASAIVLRSGKELKSEVSTKRGHARENRVEDSVARGHAEQGRPETELEIPSEQVDKPNQVSMDVPKVLVTKPPFPERFAKAKKEDEEKEIFETFRKVEVNIPLIDAIKQIPRYAKFLKELCTNKGKLKGNERAPTLELKELPKHLKYAFLGENDTLPVIISSKLYLRRGEIDSCASRVP
ncbi:UNVERIFIED_CONTAM: hypothetical protein Sradi_6220800 [Sesamum radiatum]|uniref:Retrotransposon gag protein n=1 Tax=Sesamum radiatum TaxID=300843 RepID=A0AAW2K9K0_SESRA